MAAKAERFEEFLRRLGEARQAATPDEALDQIAEILNGVEDEVRRERAAQFVGAPRRTQPV